MNQQPGSAPKSATAATRLAEAVRILELAARHNAAALRSGEYSTAVPGQGYVFHEARKYVPGEAVRRIDWNITARLGEPYVRVHREERQREIFLAVDVSPSMRTGWSHRSKLETAVELAATLAVSAVDAGDRLGYALFADEVVDLGAPRGGRLQLWRTLAALLRGSEPWRRRVAVSDPRAAIHAIEAHRRRRFVVFLISDFLDHDVPEDLEYLRSRHDVSLLHVFDPVEREAAPAVAFPAVAPEGEARRRWVSLGEEEGLPRLGEGSLDPELERRCGELGLAYAPISSQAPIPQTLGQFLHQRSRRISR